MIENYALDNYRDQIKQLEIEFDMAEQNKKMFYRLWIRWANEHRDIERTIHRLNDKIEEEIKRHPQ